MSTQVGKCTILLWSSALCFLLFYMNRSFSSRVQVMLSAGHRMSERWEDGSLAFPCESVRPDLAHPKPGKGANARDSSTTLLTLHVFFLMIKYFCYYEFTEEIQNLICRGVGL